MIKRKDIFREREMTSTTNSNEAHTPTNDRDHDHEALIISCKIRPHGSSHQSTGETFLIGNGGAWPSKAVIPERWGQEGSLKDWMDYSTFDALLAPKEAAMARQALVAQAAPRGCRVSKIFP